MKNMRKRFIVLSGRQRSKRQLTMQNTVKTLYATLILMSAIAWLAAQPAPPGAAPAPAEGAKKATNAPAVNTNTPPAGTNDALVPPVVTSQATNAPATADSAAKPTNAPTITATPAPGPGVTPSTPARSFPAFPAPATLPPRTPAVPAGAGAKPPTNALAAKAVAPGTNTAAKLDEEILPTGLIKFQDIDIVQVLDVYQELTGRTVMANQPAGHQDQHQKPDVAYAQGGHPGARQHSVSERDHHDSAARKIREGGDADPGGTGSCQ